MIDCQTTQGERFKDARTVWNQYVNQSTKAVSDATGISTSIINALENETRSVGYEKVYLMQNNMNLEVSEVISTYVYKHGIVQPNYSYSTAIDLFNNVINVTLLLIANGVSRKVSETSLF